MSIEENRMDETKVRKYAYIETSAYLLFLKFTIFKTKLKPKNKNSNTRPGKLSWFLIWSLYLAPLCLPFTLKRTALSSRTEQWSPLAVLPFLFFRRFFLELHVILKKHSEFLALSTHVCWKQMARVVKSISSAEEELIL